MKFKTMLFTLAALQFTLVCNAQPSQKKMAPKAYEIGATVQDFELQNVDGKMYSLKDISGSKGSILIFTSNVCPFAVAYEDRIIDLHKKMADMGYPVIAINSNDAAREDGDGYEAMITRHKEKNLPFMYLKDDKAEFKKFGANKTPHVFLLDSEMKVRYIGAIDDNSKDASLVTERFVENAISSLEGGKNPEPSTTKAVGCPIKSKSSVRPEGGPRGDRKGPPSAEQLMAKMDKNNDSMISKDEVEGRLANDFDRIDTDKDGMLTAKELNAMRKGRN